jgi:glycosyltransferase involved in cell wall biosynthesis
MSLTINKLTVLMTTYNCGEYISAAIKSVLNQTFTDFEFLIIDDGSTDSTEKIVKDFIDERIKYIKLEHVGRSKALNCGLKSAEYHWVAIIDADDIWHSKKLERQINEIESEKDLIFTNSAYFIDKKIMYLSDRLKNKNELYKKLIMHGHFAPSSFLFNTEEILKFGAFDENLYNSEDYDLWLRLLNDFKFKIIDEYLTFIRIRKYSFSRSDVEKTSKQIHDIQEKYFPQIFKQPEIIEHLDVNDIKGWSEFFYGNKKLARKYWMLSKRITPKIFISYLLSYFPRKFLRLILNSRIRLRINYLINGRNFQKSFDKVLLESM